MNSTITKEIKLIALYGRVSTSNQEEQETIENQIMAMKEFAKEKGYTVVTIYKDEGWSGTVLARPGLDELRTDAKKKLWDAVLIYDPDRLARRGFFQELVIDELEQLGIKTLFVTMPPVANDEDRLMFNVRGAFAEYERTKIAERFRLGKVRKAKEGNIIASEAPYGYTLVIKRGKRGDTDFSQTHYIINDSEATTLKMIFGWVGNEGLTIRKIVKRLQDMDILPRKSKRGVWNTSTLSTMLRNRAYVGEGHYGSSYATVPENPIKKEGYRKVKKTSRRMRPREEWILIPIPALIDPKLFERVQEQLKKNSVLSQRNKKNEYLLSGKLRCICGCSRSGEGPQHGKYLYYRCTNRALSYPLPPSCRERGVNVRIVDKLVWSKIAALMSSKELMMKQVQRWLDRRRKKIQSPMLDVDHVKKELAKLKDQEGRYIKAYGAGLFPIEKLHEYTTPLKEKMTSFEDQLVKAEEMQLRLHESPVPGPGDIEAFAAEATKALRDLKFRAKRAIVMRILDKVVATQRELQVYGYIPVNSYVELFTDDRHCRAPERGEVHSF